MRRQLTEKLKTNNTSKPAENSSPSKRVQDIREVFESNLGNKRNRSPIKNNSLFDSRPIASLSKSQMKFDFASELTRKIDERSPPKKNYSQDSIALSSLEGKVSAKNNLMGSDFRSSLSIKERSPLKQS